MRFAAPAVLWLLTLVPILAAALLFGAHRRRRALDRFAGGAAYRSRFLSEVSAHRRAARALLWLLAATATIVSAARPQWGTRLEPITRRGVDVVVVVDTSLSMAAEDVPPSRLGQALHAASTLVDLLAGNRVALVTFSGRARLLCPLTLDQSAARLFLDTVRIESTTVGGTALADALRVAMRSFGEDTESSPRSRAVVLFTDGEDHEGEIDAVLSDLREGGVVVHAVGTGTGAGGPIPVKDGRGRVKGYKKDGEERIITTRLDEALLSRIALDTDGRYYRATPAEVEIEEIARALAEMDAQEYGTVLRVRYEERYQFPLAVALVALLVEAALRDRRRIAGVEARALR